MNRREALAALVAMPAVTRISRAELKPDDVIVIEAEMFLSDDAKDRIAAIAKDVWPERKVVVLDGGLKMKVVQA